MYLARRVNPEKEKKKSDVSTTLRYYVDACPVQKSKILYGVFPKDLEEAAEMLADR